MKTCRLCGEAKPLSEFYKHKETRDGLYHECKPCPNARAARWRRELPTERKRALNKREKMRDFGITLEGYGELLARQGGCCAVCGDACPSGRELAIDHDHQTGEVRGLLCMRCNIGMGQFREDPDLLDAAASYLRSFAIKAVARPTNGLGRKSPA